MRMTEEEIYARDMDLLVKSEALIAEVTVPSTGVGYEICRALVQGIPVLCLYSPDAAVSAMVLGNPDHYLRQELIRTKPHSKKLLLSLSGLSEEKKPGVILLFEKTPLDAR